MEISDNKTEVEPKAQIKPKMGGSSDEKAPDSSELNGGVSKKGNTAAWTKGKKRKKTPRDSTAPRLPLTGYIRYLNDRREAVRNANPSLSFAEITKILANEWTNLPTDKKQQYLDAAEVDKERYNKELDAYKQTDAYRQFTKQQQENSEKRIKEDNAKKESINESHSIAPQLTKKELNKQNREDRTHHNNAPTIPSNNNNNHLEHPTCPSNNHLDIQIFTEEFLEHNKCRESELRQLRKSNTDYEQQNAVLQKHIERMRAAVERLEVETSAQRCHNVALQRHLDRLRATLAGGFAAVKLPGSKEVATIQTIDVYISQLHSLLLENNNHTFVKTVRDIITRLNLET